MSRSDLFKLFSALCDDALSPDEHAALQEVLRHDPQARQLYLDYLDLHGELHLQHDMPAMAASPRARGWLPVTSAVLAAASIMLAVWFFGSGKHPEPIDSAAAARVVEVTGILEVLSPSGETRLVRSGDILHAEQTLRTGDGDSYAVVKLNRTRLEIGTGTLLRITEAAGADHRLIFTSGTLRADVAPSDDGRRIVVVTPQAEIRTSSSRFLLASASADVSRIDLEAGQLEVVRQADGRVLDVPAGSYILAAAQTDLGQPMPQAVPSIETIPLQQLDIKNSVRALAYTPEGMLLGASRRQLVRWNAQGNSAVAPIPHRHRWEDGGAAAFSGDRAVVALTSGLDKQVLLWDVAAAEPRVVFDAEVSNNCLALASDGSWMATVAPQDSHHLQLWDAQEGVARNRLETDVRIGCLTASADGKMLALGLNDLGPREPNRIMVVDPLSLRLMFTLPTREKSILAMAFSPDGKLLAAGFRHLVQIWGVRERRLLQVIRGHERHVFQLDFSPDGRLLAGGTSDGNVWIWNVVDGSEHVLLHAGPRAVRSLAFAPDGSKIATVSAGMPPLVWSLPTHPKR